MVMRAMKRVRAVGYIRVSTNEDKQKYGLDIQTNGIRRCCAEKNFDLVRIYRDTTSGKSLRRQGIQTLLKNKLQIYLVSLSLLCPK